MIEKIRNFGKTKVYICVDGIYDKDKNLFDYFATKLEYSKNFAQNCYEVELNLLNSNVLDLERWNKIYKDATGSNGNKYNRTQGIFVIGEENISTNYSEPLSRFEQALGKELANDFLNELKNCDAIYGQDAGYLNEFVFAVKKKTMITKVEPI